MNEQMMKERIQQALNAQMSGVRTSPAERSEMLENAIGGRKVKRKLTVGLVFAMVLVLMTAAAVAAILLTRKEIVEQVAVPLAVQNDDRNTVNNTYTTEELAELVRNLNENGITLEETSDIMQALRSGDAYYETEVIEEICKDAFGGNPSTWTLEEQDWYRRMIHETDPSLPYESCLPGEDNMTCGQAEAFAFAAWKKKYKGLDPEDRTLYLLERSFYHDEEMNGEAVWEFSLVPRDLEHSRYTIRFADRDPEGTADVYVMEKRDWTKPYSGFDLEMAFCVYDWRQGRWTQPVWQKFHEMMQQAELSPEDGDYREYRAYQLTAYPDPAEGEITREEAICTALEALPEKQAAAESAVLTEYEGKRAWIVAVIAIDGGKQVRYAVTVDSTAGKAESVREQAEDDDKSMLYVPEAAYLKAGEGWTSPAEREKKQLEAIAAKYPELDLLNGEEYEARNWGPNSRGETDYSFFTRNIRHGDVTVTVSGDGTVGEASADTKPLNGDNLFERYVSAYGWYGDWEQDRWVQLAKDMEGLEPAGTEGKMLKMGRFPEAGTARISREEAIQLAFGILGKRTVDAVNTCMLIAADPHPVWKMRVIMYDDQADWMLEVDAETGELVSKERYKVDYTPTYALFSTEKNRRAMELKAFGPLEIARREAVYAFADLELDEPNLDLGLEDGSRYDTLVEGLTVRFTAKWAGMQDYLVELDENGYVVRCERTDTESAEEPPYPLGDEAALTPRPDGKPWFWQYGVTDEAYWNRMEQVMEEWDVNAVNYRRRLESLLCEYGSAEDLPQDCNVLYYWFFTEPEYLPDDNSSYPLFLVEGDPTREEMKAKAKEAFAEAIAGQRSPEWINALRVQGELTSDVWKTSGDGSYGKPTWIMTLGLYEYDEENEETYWNSVGFVLLDEDGTIREVVPELEGGG